MTTIATTLKRFNRKERYWVVRTALGPHSETLDAGFCAALERVLSDKKVKINPREAWWGMDYHFNWLFAALRMHCDGHEAGEGRSWSNAEGAVQGNQEDIDLVVATGSDLILVEAKNGAWSSDQLRSKIERLKLLQADESGVVGSGDQSVRLHFVLMSPSDPSKGGLGALLATAPAWIGRGDEMAWRWMELDPAARLADCKVHRSDANGKKDKTGVHWTVAIRSRGG